jgi:hypothetical protein
MGNSVQTERVLRFLNFQVNLNTGEVRKAGVRLKLQDQPFKVLATLVQRPGQVVTREELRQLIWPEESFGDFDHAINLAVNKLRSTLGDSADVPHLIENPAASWLSVYRAGEASGNPKLFCFRKSHWQEGFPLPRLGNSGRRGHGRGL